jgi:hypothetical protein
VYGLLIGNAIIGQAQFGSENSGTDKTVGRRDPSVPNIRCGHLQSVDVNLKDG